MPKLIIIIDNYDSFTYNLYQLFLSSGNISVEVFRNDRISPDGISALHPSGIVISPGPGTPADSGISMNAIERFSREIPILGVCLGMQCINEVSGGKTVHAPVPCHGKKDMIFHEGKGVLKGIPSPFTAARYHSLVIQPSQEIEVTARTSDGIPMALIHRKIKSLQGVQFHPESFMTDYGMIIARNFLEVLR